MMKKLLFFLSPLILVLTVVSAFKFVNTTKTKPSIAVQESRKLISRANKNQAGIYAKKNFDISLQYYDSAMLAWQSENKKIAIKRNYSKVHLFANKSSIYARLCLADAQTQKAALKLENRYLADSITKMYEKYNAILSKVPVNNTIKKQVTTASFFYHEAILALNADSLLLANNKLNNALQMITPVYKYTDSILQKYFESLDIWIKWESETLRNSKKRNQTCIIVDKFARNLYLYVNGQHKKTFSIELGPNWIGHKTCQGDNMTPEGMYNIVKLKTGRHTRYHKALLINYPNSNDKENFVATIGNSFNYNGIGSNIEIHGGGGGGTNWTQGCIALANNDIDYVFKFCKPGTPVTIVGSLFTIAQIIENKQ